MAPSNETGAGAATTSSAEDAAAASSPSSSSSWKPPAVDEVVIHPLVLLSAADHYHRVARGTRKRVVGVLLGSVHRGKVDATNSFAVPFEEDSRNPAVFYLDHNYLENMLAMFRKVNAKERVVGFYSTGPQIRPNDLRIHDIVERFASGTVFCIVDIRPDRRDLPVTAYRVVEEASPKSQQVTRTFAHVPCQMGAIEAEEVGVEHLLRDINDPTVSTLSSLISGKIAGLSTLAEKLLECREYLEAAASGSRPANPEIVDNLQAIVGLHPNLNAPDLVRSLVVKTNDMHMAVYLASLIRAVVALHDLVNNKIRYGDDGQHGADQQPPPPAGKEAAPSAAAPAGKEEKKEEPGGGGGGKKAKPP